MTGPGTHDVEPGPPRRRQHLAARIDDWAHGVRERSGRRRRLVPVVVPFAGYGGDGWIRVLGRVVLARPDAADRFRSIRGWRSFMSIAVRDTAVSVLVNGTQLVIRSDRGGVIDVRVEVGLPSGWQEIRLAVDDGAPVTAPVFVVDAGVRFGIVSDVDDTVMVTALPRPFLAAWNTFVLDEHARRSVPGMAVLYERLTLAHSGAPIVYLSTGAWNVVPTLTRFLGRNLFPRGVLLLTDWGPTPDRWFRSGLEHKRTNLRRLAEEFPQLRWLLIGDDGQHDEKLYAEFVEDHPDRVSGVAIRQLTPSEAVLAGGRAPATEHAPGVPWMSAPDGAGLSEQLAEHGML